MTVDLVVPLLSSLMPLLILAVGQRLVWWSGGIDLSAVSIVAVVSMAGSWLLTAGGAPVAAGVAAMLLLGLVLGLINGLALSWLRLSPFLVTLATFVLYSGLAQWGPAPRSSGALPEEFTQWGRHPVASVGLVVVLVGAVHWLLQVSLAGPWLRATGLNRAAARVAGVPVVAMTTGVYAASGFLAGLAAVMVSGRWQAGSSLPGLPGLLDVLGALLIGNLVCRPPRTGGGFVWPVLVGVVVVGGLDLLAVGVGLSWPRLLLLKVVVVAAAAAVQAPGRSEPAWQL